MKLITSFKRSGQPNLVTLFDRDGQVIRTDSTVNDCIVNAINQGQLEITEEIKVIDSTAEGSKALSQGIAELFIYNRTNLNRDRESGFYRTASAKEKPAPGYIRKTRCGQRRTKEA